MGKKQGIHGFRAFLIIVGAGTAAGLLVVWLVSLIFKTLVSVASEGLVGSEDSGGGYASPARRPVSSLEPGSFDLCQYVEGIQAFRSVYQRRLDDGSNFIDTAINNPESEIREISNECSWDIMVGSVEEAEVVLSYKSEIGGSSSGEISFHGNVESLVDEVYEEGDFELLPEGGSYIYGKSDGREYFILTGDVKNTSFSFVFKSKEVSDYSLKNEYHALMLQVIPVVREILERSVPD